MLKKLLVSLILVSSVTGNIMARATLQELENKQKQAKEKVEVGAIYRHYRDENLKYKVIDIGIQEATEEICVIYQNLYGEALVWVRNLDSWLSEVEDNGKIVKRFQKLEQ